MDIYPLLRPLLFALDAEIAHGITLRMLDLALRMHLTSLLARDIRPLHVHAMGLDFPNPVGLAAGLDKNGAHIDALAALGFGFLEIGTVTPLAQPGNTAPRLFRLPRHRAIINRFGFNNDGVDALVRNVERARFNGILGINIGKNKDTPNPHAVDDYLHCMERVYPLASYITINISSPNTQGLRDLQHEDTLRRFIGTLRDAQERHGARHGRRPMLLKIAPDLSAADMDAIAGVLEEAAIDGLICTNTTLARHHVGNSPRSGEAGGLSGAPLMEASTDVLEGMTRRLHGKVPMIGVGGILRGADARRKRDAGATLVQLYSGLIYRGPALIAECVEALRSHQSSTT